MDVGILGPLAARVAGLPVTPTATKPRKVLAVLAAHADQVVPVDAFVDELWGDAAPRSATTTLQTYVMQLRGLIGAASARAGQPRDPKRVLVTRPGGYLLVTGELDLREFERRAEAGHRAARAGDVAGAAEHFRAALARWRGDPLVDVRVGAVLAAHVRRLTEARLSVLDRRVDADLRLGRHHEVLAELTGLVARHGTHENLSAHLMVALYRAGRRGDAAHEYQRLRACLVDELGLDPSPALRGLHRRVLAADPLLLTPEPVRLDRAG
ncbi:AfsR/SARP family transcriptional regulator [Actinokineospora auranticolor]|uniref:DNA-binding SARP family transcriptional activator n=1 Tax=Actinokineospora auranticolor TaxID=155976 RepID=A0A2S6GJS0_9PSEU|nr:AfsR/SARP family transcriptional regulator [Actinokineospora auranticolor]PPK65467.1 DNA-binding SARP family transcriptional activator [Actinokineospora auranticolor]